MTLGELRAFVGRENEDDVADYLELPGGVTGVHRIFRLAEIADTCLDLWRRGRGKPVTATIIRENGLLTENKLHSAMSLLEETAGDAALFVMKITEVEGIGAGSRHKLQQGLTDLGCIVERQALDGGTASRLLRQEFLPEIDDYDTVFRHLNLRWG